LVDSARFWRQAGPSLPNYLAATSGRGRDGLPLLSWTDCSPSVVCDSSLLGTAEQLLGLPRLGHASSSPAMTAAFRL